MTRRSLEEHIMTVASVANYGGAGTAVIVWGLSLPEWAAVVSMTVAVLGFGLQVYLAARVVRRDKSTTAAT